jgi:tRNA:m4X modification enzyme
VEGAPPRGGAAAARGGTAAAGAGPPRPPPNPHTFHGHCHHWVARKARRCKLRVGAGRRYCGEHAAEHAGSDAEGGGPPGGGAAREPRVPCPIDGNHTVSVSQLAKHVLVCNGQKALDAQAREAWFAPGVNAGPGPDAVLPPPPPDLADASGRCGTAAAARLALALRLGRTRFLELTARVERAADARAAAPAAVDAARAPGGGGGAAAAGRAFQPRHEAQHASLLGHAARAGLLARPEETVFLELGAGKGYLSAALVEALAPAAPAGVAAVDMRGFRLKADRAMRGVALERVKCDLADFEPAGLAALGGAGGAPVPRWAALGKHLCGAAADLALRCCARAAAPGGGGAPGLVGLAVATCCHHRCAWRHFAGREAFAAAGFSPEEFELVAWMSGWALCGHDGADAAALAAAADAQDARGGDAPPPVGATEADWRPHHSLPRARRVRLGGSAKRLLDACRLEFLRSAGFAAAEAVLYVAPSVSGENRLLLATVALRSP